MPANKKEKQGTIHELDAQLAQIAELDEIKTKSKKEIEKYISEFNVLKLFPKKANKKQKEKIISKLKLINFNREEIENQQSVLKSIESYNRLIERERRKTEKDILSKKNVKINDKILKGLEKKEINIPRKIRDDLKIHEKAVRLNKFSTEETKNRIKYYSGQDYKFLVKNGFSRPKLISYNELQKIRKEGNVVEFLLNDFENDVKSAYEREKKKYSIKDKKKWKAKEKVFKKIFKVLEHNKQIATNKKYNKKLVSRDEEGKIEKNNSEYPILMNIFDELIDLYIP